MISQMTRGKKDTIRRKAISLDSSRQDKLALDPTFFPDVLPFLVSMAHHGFVSRVSEMSLDVDLGSLPTYYLPSLASSIWGRVKVHPLNSCDLSPFSDSYKGEIILLSTASFLMLRRPGHWSGTLSPAMDPKFSIIRRLNASRY